MSHIAMYEQLQEQERLKKMANKSHSVDTGKTVRLIDANTIQYHKTTECHGHGLFFTEEIAHKKEIEQIPAVDAVEVVHGRWMVVEEHPERLYCEVECSACGKTRWHIYGEAEESLGSYAYCPDCGAKMDGKE